jgi:hypothetical protein
VLLGFLHYASGFFSSALTLPLGFVNLTFNSAALRTNSALLREDRLCANSPRMFIINSELPANDLLLHNKISKSLLFLTKNILNPYGFKYL